MSEVFSSAGKGKNGINVYIDDVGGEGSVDRARKLLSGIPHGAEKAIGSAMKRAVRSGEALAAKVISREYMISSGDFKKYTQHKQMYETSGGSTTVAVIFRGVHIPLIKFDTAISKSGSVAVRVKRGGAKTVLDHAFSSTMGSHTGIFERTGPSRFPVREFFGPATTQMLSYNDDLSQEVGDKIREAFENRLDHEIMAVMNGWRK